MGGVEEVGGEVGEMRVVGDGNLHGRIRAS